MNAPSVNIAFIEQAISAIRRGERGTIAMILKEDTAVSGVQTILDVTDIPETLSAAGKLQLRFALMGYQNAPRKVLLKVIAASEGAEETAYNAALTELATYKWDYLVAPTAATDGVASTIASWIKSQRTNNKASYKAVLPNTAADDEAIINVACTATYLTDDNTTQTITAEGLCSRIAGIIAGTPLTMACTYAPLLEMADCQRMTKTELDEAVNAGKLVLMWDGEKVKVCRGVNSLVSTSTTKGDSFKKIKLVEAMDMIRDDISMTAQDSYIGKYVNNYDNKCLLISAIEGYFAALQRDGVIDSASCEIDLEAQRTYFKSQGGFFIVDGERISLEDATDDQVKRGNTGSHVFLRATVALLDAIEDIDLEIYI